MEILENDLKSRIDLRDGPRQRQMEILENDLKSRIDLRDGPPDTDVWRSLRTTRKTED